MPRRKEEFFNNEIYHIVLRGIDDNVIFKNINDYYRGIFSIYEFNNSIPVEIWRRRRDRIIEKKKEKLWETGSPTISKIDKRNKFVDILTFCFMPNHIHLLLKQIKDGGITRFMQKVGAGFGGYFNRRYKRKGHVFQNRFKDVHIEDDGQLMTVVNYIHANPISLIEPKFKELGIRSHSAEEVMEFLKNYKWSSYQDYIGIQNFPTVTEREFISNVIGGEKGIRDNIAGWVSYKKEAGEMPDVFIE